MDCRINLKKLLLLIYEGYIKLLILPKKNRIIQINFLFIRSLVLFFFYLQYRNTIYGKDIPPTSLPRNGFVFIKE